MKTWFSAPSTSGLQPKGGGGILLLFISRQMNAEELRIIPIHISHIFHRNYNPFSFQNLLNKFRQMVAFTMNQFLCWNFHVTDHSATRSISFTKSTPALQDRDKNQIPWKCRYSEHSILTYFEADPEIIMMKFSSSIYQLSISEYALRIWHYSRHSVYSSGQNKDSWPCLRYTTKTKQHKQEMVSFRKW
jgi:hypothetical protein